MSKLTQLISFLFIAFHSEPFQKFSSDNLGDPVINYTQLKGTECEDAVAVTLTCQVPLLNGIGALDNVTYKIEWYAEGKTLRIYERCGNVPCGGKNNNPCPNATSIQSKLPGCYYNISQSVSKIKELFHLSRHHL